MIQSFLRRCEPLLVNACGGQSSRCKAYGNYARFPSFPFIPAENLVLQESTVNVDYGKK